jgi:hypothetical protein
MQARKHKRPRAVNAGIRHTTFTYKAVVIHYVNQIRQMPMELMKEMPYILAQASRTDEILMGIY